MNQKSVASSAVKSGLEAVLFEGIHSSAVEALRQAGYTRVVTHDKALTGGELRAAIANAHFVGVRSGTHLTAEVLQHAQRLATIGCFCIGTNQVDLKQAMRLGIPVFNAPFSNTRSVAELVLAQIIFGGVIGLIYYSSLYYSMDLGDTKGEHGGIHEAAIGLGNLAGPAVAAASLFYLPQYANSGTVAVSGLLLLGMGGLLAIWRKGA